MTKRGITIKHKCIKAIATMTFTLSNRITPYLYAFIPILYIPIYKRNFAPLHEALLFPETFQKLCSLTLLPYVYNVHNRNFAPSNVLSSV